MEQRSAVLMSTTTKPICHTATVHTVQNSKALYSYIQLHPQSKDRKFTLKLKVRTATELNIGK